MMNMTLEFDMTLDSSINKLKKLILDYESYPNYLPDQIQKVISQILIKETYFPKYVMVSIADVKVSQDLRNADMRRANLQYADLRGADLTDADLSGAFANAKTLWPVGFVPYFAGVVTWSE